MANLSRASQRFLMISKLGGSFRAAQFVSIRSLFQNYTLERIDIFLQDADRVD